MGPIWGPPGSCRPQRGPVLAPWSLLSGWFGPLWTSMGQSKGHQISIDLHVPVYYVWKLHDNNISLITNLICIQYCLLLFNGQHISELVMLVKNKEIEWFHHWFQGLHTLLGLNELRKQHFWEPFRNNILPLSRACPILSMIHHRLANSKNTVNIQLHSHKKIYYKLSHWPLGYVAVILKA